MVEVTKRMHLERTVEVLEGFIIPHLFKPVKISQGYDGPYSHTYFEIRGENGDLLRIDDDTYSLDFHVPFGTNVIAAKTGVVKGFFNESRDYYEGLDYKIGYTLHPNFVVLDHGSCLSLYSHLGTIFV